MANNVVPLDDIPSNLVPASDLPESTAATEDMARMHPMIGAYGGYELGKLASPIIGGGYGVKMLSDALAHRAATPEVPPAPRAPALHGGEKWGSELTGVHVPGSQMDKEDLDIAKRMAKTVGRGGELAGGTIHQGIMLPPGVQAAAPSAAEATPISRIKGALSSVGKAITPTGLVGKAVNTALPMVALPVAGYEGVEAYNRFNEPGLRNKIQGGLGMLGAAGTAASMIPHPVTRIGGLALGTAAPAINAALDYVLPPKKAEGGPITPIMHTPKKLDALFEGIKASRIVKPKK